MQVKTIERAAYWLLLGVLVYLLFRKPAVGIDGTGVAADDIQFETVRRPLPTPEPMSRGQSTKVKPDDSSGDTFMIPSRLAPELKFFLFEPGTFILSREKLQLAGLTNAQIEATEALYAQSISSLQKMEEASAVVAGNASSLKITLPKLDPALSAQFDQSLHHILGKDMAAIIGPNLKRAEVLNGFGETERHFTLVPERDEKGEILRIRINAEMRTLDNEGVITSSVSENFFTQRYPNLWEKSAAALKSGIFAQK